MVGPARAGSLPFDRIRAAETVDRAVALRNVGDCSHRCDPVNRHEAGKRHCEHAGDRTGWSENTGLDVRPFRALVRLHARTPFFQMGPIPPERHEHRGDPNGA